LFGLGVGIAVGFLGAKYLYWGSENGWMSVRFQKICWFALVILTFGIANTFGGNGYLAAFAFGITSGNMLKKREMKEVHEYANAENSFLMLATYIVFGMVMLPRTLGSISVPIILYALLSLTLVRMIPVAISMIGARLRITSVLYMGWFGPRGIATILYILTIIGQRDIAGNSTIYDVAVLTVGLSLILHGITAWPLSNLYGKRMDTLDESGDADREMQAVPEMTTRGGKNLTANPSPGLLQGTGT
jgi:NhaP-type Na+/H+ or K+/H+ antiporter